MSHKGGKDLVLEDLKVLTTLGKSQVGPKIKTAAHFARGVCASRVTPGPRTPGLFLPARLMCFCYLRVPLKSFSF